MSQTKQFKATLSILAFVFLLVVGILSFYIVHNAQWLVGDDAIIINHTGWNIPFSVWDTIQVKLGRFFPLAYIHENLVLLFPGEIHTPLQHYIINAVLFLILNISLIITLWLIVKPTKIVDLFIIFVTVLVGTCRVYGVYLNVFSTLYNYYTICALSILFMVLFYNKKNNLYGLLSCLCWIYSTYCLENAFVIPLCIGVVSLLFGYKNASKEECLYNIVLICIAITFLSIYYFGIYRNTTIDSLYDPSHGTGVSFLENSMKILKGQKFIVFVIAIWIYRQIMLIKKKDNFNLLYDSLLWTSGAILFAGLILKLDWNMYYYTAVLCSLPSVLYIVYKSAGRVVVLVIMASFMLLHIYRIPIYIQKNQNDRLTTIQTIEYLSNKNDLGINIVWYEVDVNDSSTFLLTLRDWKKECVQSYLRFYRNDKDWEFDIYEINKKSIILYYQGNDIFGQRPSILVKHPHITLGDVLIYEIGEK